MHCLGLHSSKGELSFQGGSRVSPAPLTGSCDFRQESNRQKQAENTSLKVLALAPNTDPGKEVHHSHGHRNWGITQKAQGIRGLMVDRPNY